MTEARSPDAQAEWARALLRTVADSGVRQVVLSPGSRSTPLVCALEHEPRLLVTRHIDERSAAFFALGQARLTGTPSLLLCTSGTAPAHYYPAVIEARLGRVPLIVLSADRPFELSACSAPQTIPQVGLFAGFAPSFDLGDPCEGAGPRRSLQRLIRHALDLACAVDPGPVHLNFRARKPLEPADLADRTRQTKRPIEVPQRDPAELGGARRSDSDSGDGDALSSFPGPARVCSSAVRAAAPVVAALREAANPWLIAGAMNPVQAPSPQLIQRYVTATLSLGHFEAASQLRFGLHPDYPREFLLDALEWLAETGQLDLPDVVVQLGAPPMSASLQRLLEVESGRIRLFVASEFDTPDPYHRGAQVVRLSATALLEGVLGGWAMTAARAKVGTSGDRALQADRQRRTHELVQQALRTPVGAALEDNNAQTLPDALSEPLACQILADELPVSSLLVLGNSLAPRHLDRYCRARAAQVVVCAQRGVNGIDGVVSGALGAAQCFEGPTTLLTGDISFLHDVGGLWAASSARIGGPRRAHPTVICVLNNGGGRLFEQLPVALAVQERGPQGLADWVTPHELTLAHAASLYGVRYDCVATPDRLRRALNLAYECAEVTLIEVQVPTDSARSTVEQVRRRLVEAAPETLPSLVRTTEATRPEQTNAGGSP